MVKRKEGWARYRGKFQSLKMGRTVRWGSHVARDYLYLLEFDRKVLSFQESPAEITCTWNGELLTVAPDLAVLRRDQTELVKLCRDKDAPSFGGGRLRSVSRASRELGYELRFVTESDVRRQPLLDNVKLLWRYARAPAGTHKYRSTCHDFFRSRESATLDELAEFLSRKNIEGEAVFSLIFHGILHADLAAPISRLTRVRLAEASGAGEEES